MTPAAGTRPLTPVHLLTLARRFLWPLSLVAGLAAESWLWRHGDPPAYVIYDLAIGFMAVYVSLAVWESSPANPVGGLLYG